MTFCSFPIKFFLGGPAELRIELIPSLSCCAVYSSRWEAVVWLLLGCLIVGITECNCIWFNPMITTGFSFALLQVPLFDRDPLSS